LRRLPLPDTGAVMHEDNKYVVFKREDWEKECKVTVFAHLTPVDDAVVIRLQDQFAPPALDAYANNIQMVIEGLLATGSPPSSILMADLQRAADYFHNAAQESWGIKRKMPD
jgi:hypothetical protein